MDFDPTKTALVVFCYPDGKHIDSITHWALRLARGTYWGSFITEKARYEDDARNRQARMAAELPDSITHVIWLDSDQAPAHTQSELDCFLTCDADVVSCMTQTSNLAAYANPDKGHMGVVKMRTDVLRTLWNASTDADPVFAFTKADRGTRTARCVCVNFCDKVKAAGFSFERAGFCWHANPGVNGGH